MTEEADSELIIDVPDAVQEVVVCPFTKGIWKKAGNALIFFMVFVTPILFLVSLLITSLN